MPIVQNAPPSIQPVDYADLVTHARISGSDDNTLLTTYIKAATRLVENYLQRSLISQTWKLYIDGFPSKCEPPYGDGEIILLKPPVISVQAVYYNQQSDGVETAFTDYQVQLFGAQPAVKPAYQKYWPAVREQYNCVRVEYTAGYGTLATDVPEDIRQAIRMIVASFYEGREVYAPGLKLENLTSFPILALLIDPYQVVGF